MIFSTTNFLAPTLPSDIVVGIREINGTRVNAFNVCKYQKSGYEGNELWILLETKKIVLPFSDENEAKTAELALKTLVDQLHPNCAVFGAPIPAAPPQSIIAITLTQYNTLRTSNTLVPLQWYDVSDTFNVFDLGPVLRVQAKTVNDAYPYGMSLTTQDLVTVDTINNIVARHEGVANKNLTTNGSSIVVSNGSMYLSAFNQGSITADNSYYIQSWNSSVDATDSSNIIATENSTVTVDSASNLVFTDIGLINLSGFPGLADFSVDQTNTKGKVAKEIVNMTNNEFIYAYARGTHQEIPLLTSSIAKFLDNPIPQANAEFIFRVTSLMGSNSLTIKDSAGTILLVVTLAYLGSELVFRWNKSTNLFEYISTVQSSESLVTLTITSDGQISFPSALNPAPTQPAKSILTVNGQKQIYGALKDYFISGGTLTWTNRHFELKTIDEVEILYT